jgi:hypothetical protein
MTIQIVRCPECGSRNVFPTHYTAGSMMCVVCAHEFDIYPNRWRALLDATLKFFRRSNPGVKP